LYRTKVTTHFAHNKIIYDLQATTATTTLATSAISRDGSDVFNTTDTHTSTSESTEGRLTTGSGGLGAVTTDGADLDVEGSDAEFLASDSNVLSSQHGSVRRRFITISLNFHTTSNTDHSFTTS
jgi:hypothetical protein